MGGTLCTSWEDALGVKHPDEAVAVFEDGKIYVAVDGFLGTTAKGTLIGEYENGMVYAVHKFKRTGTVAEIENGRIYWLTGNILGGANRTLIGECSCGRVYSRSKRYDVSAVYNGDDEGAAAAAAIALFKLESDMSAYYGEKETREKETREKEEKRYERSSSSSSESSAMAPVFWIICFFIGIVVLFIAFIAAVVSGISFLLVWSIYKLIKYILKQNRAEEIIEDKNKKTKEMMIVLCVSMLLAVGFTTITNIDGYGALCSILEIIGFVWAIVSVKKGKEIQILKKSKKNKKTSDEENIVLCEDVTVDDDILIANEEKKSDAYVSENDASETPKSRLRSTMKVSSADVAVEELNNFTPAGDL